jgi:hypothetical protein
MPPGSANKPRQPVIAPRGVHLASETNQEAIAKEFLKTAAQFGILNASILGD